MAAKNDIQLIADAEKATPTSSHDGNSATAGHDEEAHRVVTRRNSPTKLGNATAVLVSDTCSPLIFSNQRLIYAVDRSALAGFLLSLSPLSCMLMGWRGAASNGASATGMYMFGGGGLLWFGGIGEWIVGNTFASVVFFAFGAFWFNFGAALMPFFNAYGAYSDDPGNPGLGFVTLSMAFLNAIFLVSSLRTNVVFFLMFACVVSALSFLTGANWQISNGDEILAEKLTVAGGAFFLGACACGWWCLASILLTAVDFPYHLPLGDLSGIVKGRSELRRVRDERH
ncbi:hypothetical protein TruAng_002258 [Truncatella angustata]|nr:hypothetical protein TruAng_002258 [Truncatella angustata]